MNQDNSTMQKLRRGPRRSLVERFDRFVWKRVASWYRRLYFRETAEYLDGLQRAALSRLEAVRGPAAPLASDERAALDELWHGRYGIPYHDTYYRFTKLFTGRFDPRYIPDDIQYLHILPVINPLSDCRVLQDKSVYGFYFPDVRRPHEVFRVVRGTCYGDGDELISRQEAIRRVLAIGRRLCVKPTVENGEGRGVRFCEFGSPDEVERLFDAYGGNFTVQEIVEQSPETSVFNPTSLNTFRITTLFLGGRFSVLASVLRVGGTGSDVDNVGAGGYGVGVEVDGSFQKIAHDSAGHAITVGHDGLPLEGRRVQSFPRLLEFVERLHRRLPYIGLIGWDVALDSSGEPLLIEFNAASLGISYLQLASGPLYGDRLEEIMDYVSSAKRRRMKGRLPGIWRPDAQFPPATEGRR